MARYGQAFKDRAVARLLPPESTPVEGGAREVSVSVATLERWRVSAAAALAEPDEAPASAHHGQRLTLPDIAVQGW